MTPLFNPASGSPDATAPQILLVEDENLVAMVVIDILVDLGCDVVGPAASVAQALNLIMANRDIDAAVLDVNLFGEFSWPVADLLRMRRIPFVFATAYQKSVLNDAYPDIFVVSKPYGLNEIRAALKALGTLPLPE